MFRENPKLAYKILECLVSDLWGRIEFMFGGVRQRIPDRRVKLILIPKEKKQKTKKPQYFSTLINQQ